jgi:hypothetical protein
MNHALTLRGDFLFDKWMTSLSPLGPPRSPAVKPVFVVSHVIQSLSALAMSAAFFEGFGLAGCLFCGVGLRAEIIRAGW